MPRGIIAWALVVAAIGVAPARAQPAGDGAHGGGGDAGEVAANSWADSAADSAADSEADSEADSGADSGAGGGAEAGAEAGGETIIIDDSAPPPVPGRPSSRVTHQQVEERMPRSAPDALRYEPGVFVQQTSAGQGSVFVRGRTGQQTVLLFDGIRLNNSLYRHGPNQYFFTIDMRSVEGVDVLRGGASTRYGSDAIGGVLNARPVEPDADGCWVRTGAMLRATTADDELGGRVQVDAAPVPALGVRAGIGYRQVGLLESGGPIVSSVTGEPPEVARFDDDGRTQLGTGFDELASDLRLVYQPRPEHRFIAAVYDYRQFDAPRTDQCPPAFAPLSECLTFDEQFHTLAYLAFDGDLGRAAAQTRVDLSVQHQREHRTRDRPLSAVENGGRDEVTTLGLAARTRSAELGLGHGIFAHIGYGADLYHDRVDSAAWTILTDIGYVALASRGQYLAGSTYTSGGMFGEAEVDLSERLVLRSGLRFAVAAARAPADPQSQTSAVKQSWPALVGHLGADWQAHSSVRLMFNLDRSFRAPNLDDLTARQATGPGYQFENPALGAETAHTVEVGTRLSRTGLRVEGWLYRAAIGESIQRAQRDIDDCPVDSAECASSWFRYQLVNLDGAAVIIGGEASVRFDLPHLVANATVAYARGHGPNPQQAPSDPGIAYDAEVPLSRIPPLNGMVEVRARLGDFYLGGGLRWALTQDHLAPSDYGDERIPTGGTPGFAVVDLRAGWRASSRVRVSAVAENILDAAYRYHGSSVNGPGRGLIVSLELHE